MLVFMTKMLEDVNKNQLKWFGEYTSHVCFPPWWNPGRASSKRTREGMFVMEPHKNPQIHATELNKMIGISGRLSAIVFFRYCRQIALLDGAWVSSQRKSASIPTPFFSESIGWGFYINS